MIQIAVPAIIGFLGFLAFVVLLIMFGRWITSSNRKFVNDPETRKIYLKSYESQAQSYFSTQQIQGDFLKLIGQISSDVNFSFSDVIIREIELKFNLLSSKDAPIAVAECFMQSSTMSILSDSGAIFINTSNGVITGVLVSNILEIKLGVDFIGKVDMSEKKIYTSDSLLLGYYKESDSSFPVLINNNIVAEISYSLTNNEVPFVKISDTNLNNENKIVLFCLAVCLNVLRIRTHGAIGLPGRY